jgi:hypothetical protein
MEFADMKTIIEMAREAGLERGGYWEFNLIRLERFVALVRADEREACAKVCEKVAVDMFTQLGREHEPYMKATAEDCAMQIRARGQSQVCCEEYNTCVRPCTPRGRNYGQKEEREACAKVCDARALEYDGFSAEQNASEKLAAAIRARGNT